MSPFTPTAATSVFLVGPHSVLVHNGITFNDRSGDECYWVDEFNGFDSADLRLSYEESTAEDGELAGPGFFGARVMTMTGYVRAGSYTQFLNMGRALLDAYIDLHETPLLIRPATGSTIFTHQNMQIYSRVVDKIQLDMKLRDSDLRGPIKRPFTVALKASKPAYESTTLHYDSIIPTSITALGRVYDRTYDLVYATFIDPAGNPETSGNLLEVHNDGNARAKPVIRLTGAMSGIGLLNQTNGMLLKLKYPILAGDYIEVDVKNGTIKNQLGENAMQTWDTSSDWLELDGKRAGSTGDNTLQLFVDSFSGSPKLEIWWRDTVL